MIVNDRSPLELAAPEATVSQLAWVTSPVTVVTIVCFCRLIVTPARDVAKFAFHTELVPEFVTERVPGAITVMVMSSVAVRVPSETVNRNV